jgi:hypothetical protein
LEESSLPAFAAWSFLTCSEQSPWRASSEHSPRPWAVSTVFALSAPTPVRPQSRAGATAGRSTCNGAVAAAIAALIESEQQSKAEFQRTLYGELVEAKRKASGLREDVIRATQRIGLQSLTSPADGVVQQLAIHTVGGVVTPESMAVTIEIKTGSRSVISYLLSPLFRYRQER